MISALSWTVWSQGDASITWWLIDHSVLTCRVICLSRHQLRTVHQLMHTSTSRRKRAGLEEGKVSYNRSWIHIQLTIRDSPVVMPCEAHGHVHHTVTRAHWTGILRRRRRSRTWNRIVQWCVQVSALSGVCSNSCPVFLSRQHSRNELSCSFISLLNDGCWTDVQTKSFALYVTHHTPLSEEPQKV